MAKLSDNAAKQLADATKKVRAIPQIKVGDKRPIPNWSKPPSKAVALLANVAADESQAITNGGGTTNHYFTCSQFTIADGDLSDGTIIRITVFGSWAPSFANSEILASIVTQSGHSIVCPGSRINFGAGTSTRAWDMQWEIALGPTHVSTNFHGKYWVRAMAYTSSTIAPIADFTSGTTTGFLLPGNGNMDLEMNIQCSAQAGTVKVVTFNVEIIPPKS